MDNINNTLGQFAPIFSRCHEPQADHSRDETLASEMLLALKGLNELDFRGYNRKTLGKIAHVIAITNNVVESQLQIPTEKVDQIRGQLLNLTSKLPPLPPKIEATLAYFCDSDAIDHNGAILNMIEDAIEHPMPFIASLSLMNGSSMMDSRAINAWRKHLEESANRWDMYLQVEPGSGEELVVFIPKELPLGTSDEERLAALDLKSDGSLKKIFIADVLSGRNGKPTFEAFTHLFCEAPKHSKLFYLAGHGGVGAPGGMSSANFTQFLSFLEKQQCKGLALTSCYSGGVSSLLFLSDREESQEGVSFPVMAQSVGDFPTRAGQEAEQAMRERLAMMRSLIEGGGEKATLPSWQRALKTLEGSKTKALSNQVQLYFPHAASSPAGFRPPDELSGTYSLTMAKLGKALIDPKSREGLQLDNCTQLALFPLTVDIPITFSQKMPLLLAPFPGHSHHYLSHLTAKLPTDLTEWVAEMGQLYGNAGVRKAFFIEKWTTPEGSVEGIVLYMGPSNECYYKQGGKCFFCNGKDTIEISSLRYALEAQASAVGTCPSKRAEMAGTAGRQSDRDFFERVKTAGFFSIEGNGATALFPKGIDPEISLEKLLDEGLIRKEFPSLSLDEQQTLLIQLSHAGKGELITELVQEHAIDVDFTDLNGTSLLHLAIFQNDLSLVQFLVERGASLNYSGVKGRTPLHYAASRGDEKILAWLLQQEWLIKDRRDDSGARALHFVSDPALISLFKEHGCLLDVVDAEGITPLGAALRFENYPLAQAFLTAGASPSEGNPSPLFLAILSGKTEPLRLLLEAGAKVFEEGPSGNTPFIDCIDKGTPEQVKLFLEKGRETSADLNQQTSTYKTPLDTAFSRGKKEIIRSLLEAGAADRISDVDVTEGIKDFIKRDPEFAKLIAQERDGDSLSLTLFLALLESDPKAAEEFFKAHPLHPDPTQLEPKKLRQVKNWIFFNVCSRGTLDLFKRVQKEWEMNLDGQFLKAATNNPPIAEYLQQQKSL